MNMEQLPHDVRPFVLICLTIGPVLAGALFFRRFLGSSRGVALSVLLFSMLAALGTVAFNGGVFSVSHYAEGRRVSPLVDLCQGLLAFVTVPFVVKLYRKWLGNQLTDDERAPGVAGVRAWLRGGNL